ncbi:hypothetical protein RAS2_21850 [Phycisphaerae bacterium RAS2]|nr:hypothetical protein RAS2_21850 [Phycisphaerae bacterium RAS2]
MRTSRLNHVVALVCVGMSAGCAPNNGVEVQERQTRYEPSNQDEKVDFANASESMPAVIRGLDLDAAVEQLAQVVTELVNDGAADHPLDIDPFEGLGAVRTTLDRYLEERFLEALNRHALVVVPRTDDVVKFNRRISQSREGQVAERDRLEFGRQRSASLLIKARTTRLASHIELFVTAHRIESGEMAASRRVELAWDANLRELDKVRLVLPEEVHDPTVLSAAAQSGAALAVEGEPLHVACRMDAFVPSGISNRLLPRAEPLVDGGMLRTDDAFAIHFKTNRDCHVYAFLRSSDGSTVTIFPHDEIQLPNRVSGNKWHRIPDADAAGQVKQYQLDDVTGIETVYLVASEEPLKDLADIARRLGAAGSDSSNGDTSQRLIAKMNAPDKQTWLQHQYVSRPGSKGIRQQLVPSDNTTPPGQDESKAARMIRGLESYGVVTAVLTIRHVDRQ